MAQIYSNTWSVSSSGYGSGSFTYRIRVDESNNNITNKTHAITVYFDIIGVKSYYNSMSPTSNTFTITHNGTNPASPINANSSISGAKSTNYSSWTQIGSWSGTVTGNSDGTLTLNISITYGNNNYNYMPTVTTISTGTINATTLPRASELSLGSSSLTISSTSGSLSYSITAKSSSFYNKLIWSVAGSANTPIQKGLGSSTGSISYSDIINKMPSASSGKLIAVVETYSDSGYSTLIGTSSEASCNITLDTSQSIFKPTVTLGNIDINTTPTNISVAVAGYSTLKATFSSSAGSGSTIDAVYFTSSNGSLNISSSTAASGTVTSKTLPVSSSDYTFTLNAYAIDKRGSVSNTVTKTYTVKGYAPPALTFKAYRVAANVSASPYPQDNAGGYVWVSFTNTISLTSSGNAVTSATCKYKRSTDSSWTTLSTNPTGTNASSNPNPTLATTSSMTVTYTVQDRISSNEVTINVGTARYAFDLFDNKSNVGVGLGTIAEAGFVKTELPTKGFFLYGTCATARDTARKVVSDIPQFTSSYLVAGTTVFIKFTNANGVANPTLSINGTTAKSIKRYGTTAPSTARASSWNAGSVVCLVYDGTYWQQVGYLNTNTTYSEISVDNITSTTGSSTGLISGRRFKSAFDTNIISYVTAHTDIAWFTLTGIASNNRSVAAQANHIPTWKLKTQIGNGFSETSGGGNIICNKAGVVRVSSNIFGWRDGTNGGGLRAYIRVKGVNDEATKVAVSWLTNITVHLEGFFTVAANDVLNVNVFNDSGSGRIGLQESCTFIVEYVSYS